MKLGFHVPINTVSFGQISIALLREAMKRGIEASVLPIGQVNLSSNNIEKDFNAYLAESINRGSMFFDRDLPTIKIWHLHGEALNCPSKAFSLLSFYELDSPTPAELHVASQVPTAFSSKYTVQVFKDNGVETKYIPLGFDESSFYETKKKYFSDDRITFTLAGKFENRKHHLKIIKAWTKAFGNDRRYYLNAALYNPHFDENMNENLMRASLCGVQYFNVGFQKWMPNNQMYNDYLNAGNIVIGMSGGEGWGLPEFQSLCLGKHGVIMNAHSYSSWANDVNSVLVESNKKISSEDGVWFKKGAPINQGEIFDFSEEAFIEGCKTAIERYKNNPYNEAGAMLKQEFSYSKTLESLIEF